MKYEHLLGRQFELGRHDCLDMFRQIYIDNFDIKIKNYARPRDWNADHIDLVNMAFEREGFFKLHDWTLGSLRPGDVLCMAIGTSKPNHWAVYVGNNTIAHHKVNTLSNAETLRDFWRKSTCFVLRHKDVPDLTEPKETGSIMELINERNARHLEQQAG